MQQLPSLIVCLSYVCSHKGIFHLSCNTTVIKTQQLISNQVLLKTAFFLYFDLKLSLHWTTLDKGEVSEGRSCSSRTGIFWGGPDELERIAAQETHLIWHSYEYLTFYKEIQKCNQPYSLWCSRKYRLSSMCCLCEHERLKRLGKRSSSSFKYCWTSVEQAYHKNWIPEVFTLGATILSWIINALQ